MPVVPFTFTCVLDKSPAKIECVESWGERLLVGTAEGYLLVFDISATQFQQQLQQDQYQPAVSLPSDGPQFMASCAETHKNFGGRRAVMQLGASQDAGALVALCGEGPLTVHELAGGSAAFAMRASLAKTKGCTTFVLGRSGSVVRLVVAVKRKVLLYTWEGSQFVETAEVSMSDTPRALAWADPLVYVGSRREYCMVNPQNGVTSPLFPTGRQGTNPNIALLPSEPPMLLLSRDNLGVFVLLDGRAARDYAISWTESPASFVYAHPYAVALQSKFVEVRWAAPGGNTSAVHTIPIKAKCAVTARTRGGQPSPDVVYVATPAQLFVLARVPVLAQVNGLVAERDFETALTLCECLPREQPELRAATWRRVRTAQALALFSRQGNHRKALELFAELRTDICDVLALYGNLLPQHIRPAPRPDVPELQGAAREAALRALVQYLLAVRPEVCTAAEHAKRAGQPEADYSSCSDRPTILDTTLLCVSATIGEERALREVAGSPTSFCNVKECESVLGQLGRHAELVMLLRSKGLHARALEVLSNPKASMADPVHTIEYLRGLGPAQAALIFEHSRRVLRMDPENALKIFTDPEGEELPRQAVLQHLKSQCPSLVLPYLECIIQKGETGPEFHNELIYHYVEKLMALKTGVTVTGPAGSEPGGIGKTRQALLRFLRTSRYYKPEAMMTGQRFPRNDLYEEQVIILGRLGHHAQALATCVYRLHDIRAAEEYCQANYNEDRDESKDVYLTLLQVYLRPSEKDLGGPASGAPAEDSAPLIGPAMALLNKHHQKMEIFKALELFPPTTCLAQLLPFFDKVLRDNTRRRRDMQVTKSLLRSENLQVREMLINERSHSVKVDEGRACVICGKALRNSAFARYPDDRVAHYLCYQRELQAQQGSPVGSLGSSSFRASSMLRASAMPERPATQAPRPLAQSSFK
eukprot:m51a1_g9508 hypothetical protein (932) ;mRNA; f:687120-690187